MYLLAATLSCKSETNTSLQVLVMVWLILNALMYKQHLSFTFVCIASRASYHVSIQLKYDIASDNRDFAKVCNFSELKNFAIALSVFTVYGC